MGDFARELTHRSHVTKLQLVDGKLKRWDSGGFQDIDLFVTVFGGDVRVVSGEFKEFNKWEGGKDIGTVRARNSQEIQIVDAKGVILTPTFSYQEEPSQQDGAANGSQPFSSDTNRTSSAAGSRR